MASTTRFPHLAPPFAIVGAAGGWLSAMLLGNPLVRMTWPGKQWSAALVAMVLAAGAGALLTRWCVGKRYAYELEEADPEARVPTDTWPRHVTAVLLAGTLTGLSMALVYETYRGPLVGALCGLACATAFVPVCVAVILAARRAQRARLGSIVSASDRRAVWGILATALAVTTLEGLLDWPAFHARDTAAPLPAVGMALGAGLVIAAILAADVRALRRARGSVEQGLTQREPGEPEVADTDVPRLDLGLGEDSWARLARSASAYRGRDRTLALIQGNPEQALGALRRAIRRGGMGLAAVGAVAAGHAAANLPLVDRMYAERRCDMDDFAACTRAAEHARAESLDLAISFYIRACEGSDAAACLSLARIFADREPSDVPAQPGGWGSYPGWQSVYYRHRACETGDGASCRLIPYHPVWFGYGPRIEARSM